RVEVVMPKMGEAIMEGTVIEWTKSVGDTIEQDETLLEIATDKVDSEVPSPASGVLVEILAELNDTIELSKVIAILDTDASAATSATEEKPEPKSEPVQEETPKAEAQPEETVAVESTTNVVESSDDSGEASEAGDGKFYSPLVRSIA